jgi:hypothetical protein
MQPITNMPPTDWPKVTVGGKSFLMRYTSASLLLLADWGVPVGKMQEWQSSLNESGRAFSANVKLALATLGNFDSSGEWEPLDQNPLKTIAKLVDGEMATLMQGFAVAMAKVAPPATPSPAPEAKSEGTPQTPVN